MEQKELWPGWEVVAELGGGSFGKVYQIRRNTFGHVEQAALKVITIPHDKSDIDVMVAEGCDRQAIVARLWQQLQGILGEYTRMADVKGHTNVVYCDDFRYQQHENGLGWTLYIKMELLTPMLRSIKVPVAQDQVIRLGKDLCQALELCRSRNIVHRDIKPQNIFISKDGDHKLGDFGISKTSSGIAGGTKAGTFQYMAPEIYLGKPYGTQADIYSLGMVMYWMLNRCRLPFLPPAPAEITQEIDEAARNRRFSGEALPPPLDGSPALQAIVLRACAWDPADRYENAQQMAQALAALDERAVAHATHRVFYPEERRDNPMNAPGTMWKKPDAL